MGLFITQRAEEMKKYIVIERKIYLTSQQKTCD